MAEYTGRDSIETNISYNYEGLEVVESQQSSTTRKDST